MRPQLVNYKRIMNLKIMIDYTSEFMTAVCAEVEDAAVGDELIDKSEGHILCRLADLDPDTEDFPQSTALVDFREAILYAFFLNLPQTQQALKAFTLCLKIPDQLSLANLTDNDMRDPLIATGLVRTLTMLFGLRKVVIEVDATFGSNFDQFPDALRTELMFATRLSTKLGPCTEEGSVHDTDKVFTYFQGTTRHTMKEQHNLRRLTYYPAAHWRSIMAGLVMPPLH